MTDDPLGKPPPFDPEALLDQLARSVEEHKQVVALRPIGEQVADSFGRFGDLLYQFAEASRRLACLNADRDPDQTYAWMPLDGSLAEADLHTLDRIVESFCSSQERVSHHWLATNPFRNPASWGMDFLARCFRTTAENITAIGALTATGRHLRAPLILTRSVVEVAATACFVVDTAVGQRERTRRVLNLHLAQAKESLLEAVGVGNDAHQAVTELEELMEFALHAGYELYKYKPSGWAPPVIVPTGNQPRDSTRAIIDEVLPGFGASIWRSLSAVSHSRGATTLLYDEYVLAHDLYEWQRTEVIARHGLAALLVVKELCVRLEAYLGWDFEDWADAIDEMLKQCFVAAGMADSSIREHLGLKPQS